MAERQRAFALLLHRIAVERGHHRGWCAGDIDRGRGDRPAAHARHIDTGTGHQRGLNAKCVGEGQQERHRQCRGQPRNGGKDRADDKAEDHISKVDRIGQQGKAAENEDDEIHDLTPQCREANPEQLLKHDKGDPHDRRRYDSLEDQLFEL